ncbi:MAG: 4-hydroxybenzoate octaprenyltransferase [Deltaproteobacteria bacterium]|nr:4-hydroxybenzoate octaprenyltransferase [Deltaproteobacteria bacterium]
MEREKIRALLDLIRFGRPVGTYLVLFPTLSSLFLAGNGRPPLMLIAIFSLGSFIMRSAGCAINDFADREIDGRVERTKGRPLASGSLTVKEALYTFILLFTVAFILALRLNRLAFYLCFAGLFLATSYPFMKRFIQIPQAFMVIAFGWGAIIAWAAVRDRVDMPAVLIFLATALWATGYDTIYALQDMADDRQIGVRSSAIFFGKHAVTVVSSLYAGTMALLLLLGVISELGALYYTSLAAIAAIFVYQVMSVNASPDRETVFRAFKSNVRIGAILLAGIVFDFILKG